MKIKILLVLLFCMIKVEAQTSTFSVADSLFEKGRYRLALETLDKLEEPSFLSNYKKALIYESIDNYKKTAEYLEKALVFKEDYQSKLKLAKAYLRLKKSNKSVSIYEDILEIDSLNLILKYQLGKLYLVTKNADKAISIFEYLISKDQLNAHYSYQLALAFAIKNDRDRMINSFIDTYKKDTLHLKAISRLAISFNKLRDIDSTKLFVEKGLLINKDDVNLNKLKINQLFREQKYLETIPLLLNLDSISKKDTYSLSMLGKSYYNLDSLEIAKKYFTKLSFKDREDFKANTYLGHIAMKEKKYMSAMMNYTIATRKGKEKRDEEFYGLAMMFYETKKPKQAIDNFEKAFKENYNNYRALFQLAKLSDDYYKEKKIAYKHYVRYLDRFQDRDEVMTAFVKRRVKEIKKEYFLTEESLD
ncbi:hypothetical protein MC378_13405 [Polaribacter sp. MSW13]|uniref:Tetratricopeptide repeat-containing protein n=1 Tax=Polaribacter marinus TaxID=2916838 RepID=A0A9X1VP45_9FLAO|nr:hypothetical protein [Polaribacter marinus]MCI2230169.1 hypothetical protein [Polaribacter marinus]